MNITFSKHKIHWHFKACIKFIDKLNSQRACLDIHYVLFNKTLKKSKSHLSYYRQNAYHSYKCRNASRSKTYNLKRSRKCVKQMPNTIQDNH